MSRICIHNNVVCKSIDDFYSKNNTNVNDFILNVIEHPDQTGLSETILYDGKKQTIIHTLYPLCTGFKW